MRLAVFTDHVYSRAGGVVYGDRAYVRFLTGLRPHVERLVLIGRLGPPGPTSHYPLAPDVTLVGLPHYSSLAKPGEVARVLVGAARRFWRTLDGVDVVWLHGPHPMAIVFAALARARGRRIVLAVRQDLPAYTRSRHPGNRAIALAADVLEAAWRRLARRAPVVAVGPDRAAAYAGVADVLELNVSMVHERDLAGPDADRDFAGQTLTALSVGRLDAEKNPLLLADVLALLRERDPRWRLVVVGEGPLESGLRERLNAAGLADHADLLGYVRIDGGLLDLYRSSDAFVHVSWTEGLPQVLWEAFALRLPVVATAVGGVPEAAAGAAVLVPPGDAAAAADALHRIATEPDLRRQLVAAGAARVRERTIEVESARVVRFLEGAASGP